MELENNMHEYPDNELINLVSENNEEARDLLYDKYKYIVDIIYNKYRKSAYALSVDLKELRQEALVGFSDALVCYNQEKDASLSTFITLCVERKVRNFVRDADTQKNKFLKEAYSLDQPITAGDSTLQEFIGDTSKDPQVTLEMEENLRDLKKKIDELLSPLEKEVYQLLVNEFSYDDIASILNINQKQVYNCVSRIREKIKDII